MGGACSAHGGDAYKILVEKAEEKRHSEDLGVDGSIVLKYIMGN
jgi:hypothetical protein